MPSRLAVVFALLAGSAFAELPAITLATVMPPGGRSGGKVEVVITGANLEEAEALHFSHPGITGKAAGKKFAVSIAPEVPPGIYDVRVSGKLGVSNPRAFVVSELPELVETKPNDQPEAAVELPIGSVFNGAVAAAVDDHFKFTAKRGERVLVECAAIEIDSRLAPVLAVFDARGRELAASRRGGLLDFTAPADAVYALRLHDLAYAGGPEHFYRLTIATSPHLDFVFPPSGQPGVKTRFTLYGRNLPGGAPASLASIDGRPLEKLEVEIEVPTAAEIRGDGLLAPAAAAVEGFSYRFKSARGVSNPVFISFSGAPIMIEREPNDQPAQAQKATPPCEIAGQFYPAADVDCFTFDAKKGELWRIEALSNRLDLPTNPFVLVQREAADVEEAYGPEAKPTEKRFSPVSNDPATHFEVKEDGAYRVKVRDLFGNARRDPRSVYRLSIRKDSPDFHLAAYVEPPPETAADRTAAPRAALIRAGGTTAIKVFAFRRDNFADDIELRAEGLPAGVTCVPAKILAGKNEGLLLLTAVEKPERSVGPIHIIGKARSGETELIREARGAVVRWPVADFNTDAVQVRLTRDFALAVSALETAPVSIAPAEEKLWEAAAGGKLAIALRITRRGEFAEPLKLKAFGAPGIEALKEIDIDAKAAAATVTIDLASAKIPAGSHTIYFQGQAKGKLRGKAVTTAVYSTPIRIAVTPPAGK